MAGMFGGYRTRQEQLDAQEAGKKVQPDEEQTPKPRSDVMYADGAFKKRGGKMKAKKKSGGGSWPW